MRLAPATRRILLILAVMLPAVLLLSVGSALARGGGGQGFGGGGDGGGGGGDGGDGDWGGLIQVVFWLVFEEPAIGLPVMALLVIFMAIAGKKGKGAYQARVIRRGSGYLSEQRKAEALAAMLRRDPAFDETRFSARSRAAFLTVQEAWCAHDLSRMRAFVSDGIHERFSLQTKEQVELAYRDRMDELRVRSVSLAEVVSEGPFDVVTVAVEASAKDYRVSEADGKRLRGTDVPEDFVEYWSFLRRRGTPTKPEQAGLIEGQCPNCGAAIEMNQWSSCAYCKAALRSGEFDWVLAEITQAIEWSDAPQPVVPGVEALRAKDPAFGLQHLEDRASVMFWRWSMAQRTGGIGPLRKIASPQFVEAFPDRLAPSVDADGTRRWIGERAVGSVATLGVGTTRDRDRAVVSVRWQGTRFSAKPGGVPDRGEMGAISETLFSLSRAAGAKSDAGASVSSAHCPFCGAPELGGESDACEHCGQVLNDGSRDWVLDEVASRYAPEGQRALAEVLASAAPPASAPSTEASPVSAAVPTGPPARAACMAWLVHVMMADGQLDAKEREILDGIAEKAGMRRDVVEALIASARSGGTRDAPKPADAEEARAWMEVMAEVALADGRIDPAEARLLSELGAANGVAKADVALVLARTRTRLFRQAKAALSNRGAA